MQRAKSLDTFQSGGGNEHFLTEEWNEFQRKSSYHNVFQHFVRGVSSKKLDAKSTSTEALPEIKAKSSGESTTKEDTTMSKSLPETISKQEEYQEQNKVTAEASAKATESKQKQTPQKIIENQSLEDSEFNQIFVSPNFRGNANGDVVAAEFYDRPTLLKVLRSTDQALARREVPVATWVRNSTLLTRNYNKYGGYISANELLQSVKRRQKLLRVADDFNSFKKYDTKARHKLINRRRIFDQTLDATIKEIEHETFTLTRGERESAFPKDFAFPFIGAPKKPRSLVGKMKRRKKRRSHRSKHKNKHKINLSESYELRHSSSRKALKSLQKELLKTMLKEKYGSDTNADKDRDKLLLQEKSRCTSENVEGVANSRSDINASAQHPHTTFESSSSSS